PHEPDPLPAVAAGSGPGGRSFRVLVFGLAAVVPAGRLARGWRLISVLMPGSFDPPPVARALAAKLSGAGNA
ncbi:MAG: hypothetical protein ACE5EF_10270, partial [Dehalococcoidia bacterium]